MTLLPNTMEGGHEPLLAWMDLPLRIHRGVPSAWSSGFNRVEGKVRLAKGNTSRDIGEEEEDDDDEDDDDGLSVKEMPGSVSGALLGEIGH